jgi:hypothetical protein
MRSWRLGVVRHVVSTVLLVALVAVAIATREEPPPPARGWTAYAPLDAQELGGREQVPELGVATPEITEIVVAPPGAIPATSALVWFGALEAGAIELADERIVVPAGYELATGG